MQPSTLGMVQDDQPLEERLEKIETPKAQTDQNDRLLIKNIDINCNDHEWSTIRVTERWRNPETGQQVVRFKDQSSEFNHADGFTVKWSGTPITLKPGEQKWMPRFIGTHYASKLADHLLDQMGIEKMLRNSPTKRPEMLKKIILDEQPFISTLDESVGSRTQSMIDELNPAPEIIGIGNEAYNGAKGKMELHEADATPTNQVATDVGNIRNTEIEPTEGVIARIGAETPEDSMNIPEKWQSTSKVDVIKLIRNMAPDFQFGSTYSKGQLVAILTRM